MWRLHHGFPALRGNDENVSAVPDLHASEIMNGKHSLVEKFSALTIFLDDEANPTRSIPTGGA
jgi:hypothetical protein